MGMIGEASWELNMKIVKHEEGIKDFEVLIFDDSGNLGSLAFVLKGGLKNK